MGTSLPPSPSLSPSASLFSSASPVSRNWSLLSPPRFPIHFPSIRKPPHLSSITWHLAFVCCFLKKITTVGTELYPETGRGRKVLLPWSSGGRTALLTALLHFLGGCGVNSIISCQLVSNSRPQRQIHQTEDREQQ